MTFGLGWGLVGYCPGPAIAGLGFGLKTWLFVDAMLMGMALHHVLIERRSAHRAEEVFTRIDIVGRVAAGASAAAKARRTNESVEIVMFERGPYVSYANCGLPYYVGGEISSRDALFVSNPDRFTSFFRVDVRLNTEVVGICASDREVSYIDPDKGRPDVEAIM